jgi:hypothetical protein
LPSDEVDLARFEKLLRQDAARARVARPAKTDSSDSDEQSRPTQLASGCASSNEKKPRGRPKADHKTRERESKLADDWQQAKEAGTCKEEFAKDEGMSFDEFNRLLDRVGHRNGASNNSLRKSRE